MKFIICLTCVVALAAAHGHNGKGPTGKGPSGPGNGPSGPGNGPSGPGYGPTGPGYGPTGPGYGPTGNGPSGPTGPGYGPTGNGPMCPFYSCPMDFADTCENNVQAYMDCAEEISSDTDQYCQCNKDELFFSELVEGHDLTAFLCDPPQGTCDARIQRFGDMAVMALDHVEMYDSTDASHVAVCQNWSAEFRHMANELVAENVALDGCAREISFSYYFSPDESPFVIFADFVESVCGGCDPIQVEETCISQMGDIEHFHEPALPGHFDFCGIAHNYHTVVNCTENYVMSNDACAPIRPHAGDFAAVIRESLDYTCQVQGLTQSMRDHCDPDSAAAGPPPHPAMRRRRAALPRALGFFNNMINVMARR